MGMIKNLRKLTQQAKEIDKTFDPGAQMANAQQQMAAATKMMEQQTKAANVAMTGTDGTAMIVAVRQAGAMINMQPTMELDLTVMPEGRPPYPVTIQQVVPQHMLASLQAGSSIKVKIDPNDPSVVFLAFA